MAKNEVKILHCADFHLGAQLSTIGDKASQRRDDLLHTFEKIIEICRKEKVEFLLISGDLFDRINIEPQLVSEVIEHIASIPETIVAISPGNHDPFSVDSYYHLREWPTNTVIFSDELSYVVFEEKGVCLWGAGFTSTYIHEPVLRNSVGTKRDDLINICVLHAELLQTGQSGIYNPITKEMVACTPFDYLALGHVHRRSLIKKEGKTFFAYCGCPDGHGFDEPGEQGVYIGTVSKGRHTLQFMKTSSRTYNEIPVVINDCRTHSEMAARVINEIRKINPDDYMNDLYKVVLVGEIPPNMSIDTAAVESRIVNDVFFIKVVDSTEIAVDLDEIGKEETLKGLFVRKMRDEYHAAIADKNEIRAEIIKKALGYGLKAFEGEVELDENNAD